MCARGGSLPVLSLGAGTLAMLPFVGMALLVLVLLTWFPVVSTGPPNLIPGASR